MKISKYFAAWEFACPCGCETDTKPTPELLTALDKLREALDRPINITSGIRCGRYNTKVGGAIDSRHLPLHADAADIACLNSLHRAKIVMNAYQSGFTAIKVYPKHVHVDVRPGGLIFIV